MSQAELSQRIVDMTVWHLRMPVSSRRDHGIGTMADACEVIVVRLTTETGCTGFGEASPWVVFTGSPEASYAALDRYFRPLVVGQTVADRLKINQAAARAVAWCTEAKAALDTALLDLTGKILGLPVCRLLNDQAAESLPLSCSLANPDFEQDLALVERIRADGVSLVKVKAGFADHAFDMHRIEMLREQFPDLSIRVDFNQGLAVDEALPRVTDIARLQPDFIEQPVAAHEFETMARIRDQIDIPLLADESVFGPEDMRRAIRERICDGVSIKLMKAGSVDRAMQVAKLAGDNELLAYGGDMFETGLAHAAGAHLIAACPQVSLGCEFYQSTYYLNRDILSRPLTISDGNLIVPSGPGLGVQPDEDLIATFAV